VISKKLLLTSDILNIELIIIICVMCCFQERHKDIVLAQHDVVAGAMAS